MEKRAGWGAEYAPEVRNGNWEYAAFMPDGSPNAQANANTQPCFACHKPHEKQDFVISLASLAGKFPTAAVAAKTGRNDVNIKGFTFGPGTLSVEKGQGVNWTNGDDSPHQVSVAEQIAEDGRAAQRAEWPAERSMRRAATSTPVLCIRP